MQDTCLYSQAGAEKAGVEGPAFSRGERIQRALKGESEAQRDPQYVQEVCMLWVVLL